MTIRVINDFDRKIIISIHGAKDSLVKSLPYLLFSSGVIKYMELKIVTKKKIIDSNYVYETEGEFRKFLYKYMQENGKDIANTDYLGKVKIIVEIIED